MVYLFYARFHDRLPAAQFGWMLQQLPAPIQDKIIRFRNWQDAQRSLLGNMLLLKALQILDLPHYSLADLQYTNYKRPYFDEVIDFNISHSGEYIVCALSTKNRVGVDIELIKDIPVQDLKTQFSPREWLEIAQASNKLHAFYTHWTQKEAFLKAIGLGLSFSPGKINFVDGSIEWESELWYCQEVVLSQNYICHVVADKIKPDLLIKEVYLY